MGIVFLVILITPPRVQGSKVQVVQGSDLKKIAKRSTLNHWTLNLEPNLISRNQKILTTETRIFLCFYNLFVIIFSVPLRLCGKFFLPKYGRISIVSA